MAKTRTAVFVVLSLAGSLRQMASRQIATVLNRLSSGGIGEPDVYPVLPLGAAKGEPPMGEHSQRLGITNAAKHPMRRTKVSKSYCKLQAIAYARSPRSLHCPNRSPNLHTHVCQAPKGWSAAHGYPKLMGDSPGAPSPKLCRALLAAVAAAPVALAVRLFHGAASSPKAISRVLVHIVLLAGVSGSGAQLVGPMADSSESATDASAGPSRPPSVDLDAFYSADVEKVAAVLGPEMHFHHGLASAEVNDLLDRSTNAGPAAADGAVAERALADALRILYPHIPLGSSVLDVGCGWCGPAALLAAERAASVRGLTIARAQAEFCRARRDVPTLHADVEETDVGQLLRMAPSRDDGEAPSGVLLPRAPTSALMTLA